MPRRPDLLDFRERFHNWYFSEQARGMFLSQAVRHPSQQGDMSGAV
jgi:hypothetical protein